MNIDTSDWGPFDPNDPSDAMCERERLAFTEYTIKRLKKMERTGSDQSAIWTGAMMSIVQMAYAIHAGTPPDAAREALHQVLDFAWIQCATIGTDRRVLS